MKKKKLGIYVHIPFCVKKCLYCDFLSAQGNETQKEAYVDCLVKEITDFQDKRGEEYVADTIFIGGGTPTCLTPKQLRTIGKALAPLRMVGQTEEMKGKACVPQHSVPEFTIEANPGTISKEHIEAFFEMGVNRVSLGLQSAQNAELQALGRIHTYEKFLESYDMLREQGFTNINVDLMAAIPGQTKESYVDTLQKIIKLSPEHISSYSLIIEENTPFYEMEKKDMLSLPSEETERELYDLTEKILNAYSYERYEISNYAKRGYESRHNLKYWSMDAYIGFGLGAASYFEGCRIQNTASWENYQACCVDYSSGKENIHKVSKTEQMEEFMFLGLRKRKGISKSGFTQKFGVAYQEIYGMVTRQLKEKGLLQIEGDSIMLTSRGIDVSNQVLAEFLLSTTES